MNHRHIVAQGITMSVIGVMVLGCRARSEPPRGRPTPTPPAAVHEIRIDPKLLNERIHVATAERRSLRGALVLPGEVIADEDGEGDALALASGRLAAITVHDGDRVEKGHILAWVDAPELARLSADVVRARTQAVQAERLLARQVELESKQATSKNALDEARARAEGARADLLAARTVLRGIGGSDPPDTPSYTFTPTRLAVRAPIDGVVVKRMTQLGSAVAPDRPLFHLVAPGRVYILAKLPETAHVAIAEGDRATVTLRERAGHPLAKCEARVDRSFGMVDPSRNVPIRLEPSACAGMVAGRYVDVSFETHAPSAEGVIVPNEAVVEARGARVVFVQRDATTFAPRTVRLGDASASEAVIDDGVAEGERVVVRGALLLKGELLRSELENP